MNTYGNPSDNDEDDTATTTASWSSHMNSAVGDGFNKAPSSVQSTVADGANAQVNGAVNRGLAYAKVGPLWPADTTRKSNF